MHTYPWGSFVQCAATAKLIGATILADVPSPCIKFCPELIYIYIVYIYISTATTQLLDIIRLYTSFNSSFRSQNLDSFCFFWCWRFPSRTPSRSPSRRWCPYRHNRPRPKWRHRGSWALRDVYVPSHNGRGNGIAWGKHRSWVDWWLPWIFQLWSGFFLVYWTGIFWSPRGWMSYHYSNIHWDGKILDITILKIIRYYI